MDFRDFGDGSSQFAKDASQKLFQSFQTSGTAYIRSSIVTEDKIQNMLQWDRKLFALSPDIMQTVKHPKGMDVHRGHVAMGTETIKGVTDPKETFEIGPDDPEKYPAAIKQPNQWPDESHLPGFRADCNRFMSDCQRLSETVFKALTIAIPAIPDGFLTKCHSDGWHFRLLHYPPSTPKQDRLSTHSDFGSFSFVFQDSVGGLEIEDPASKDSFVPASPMTGGIIVHIGDVMARWSNDILHSTVHKVVPATADDTTVPARYSMVYYTHPNMDSNLDALPGTFGESRAKKYPPISTAQFMAEKFKEFYPDGGQT